MSVKKVIGRWAAMELRPDQVVNLGIGIPEYISIIANEEGIGDYMTLTVESGPVGGVKAHVENGSLIIDQEGGERKMVRAVEQITFSGAYARKYDQPVMYITERAVFELRKDGIYLVETAPGIDVQSQILDQMDFIPKIEHGGPKQMDSRIFRNEPMGLK